VKKWWQGTDKDVVDHVKATAAYLQSLDKMIKQQSDLGGEVLPCVIGWETYLKVKAGEIICPTCGTWNHKSGSDSLD
jgi:hypothetical protein